VRARWELNVRNYLRQAAALSLAAALAIGILVATAVPAVACSCMEAQPMAAYAGDADHAVFTGVVQAPDGRGVPVRVTRWFQGPSRDAMVWLGADGFGLDGASCRTALPPAGTEWIFVAYRTETGGLGVNLCTPHAAATDPAGQAMFVDAVATFGQGLVLDPPPEPPSTTTTPSIDDGLPVAAPVLIAPGLALIAVIGVIAGLAIAAWRRSVDRETA
jgi:hypothetical protein